VATSGVVVASAGRKGKGVFASRGFEPGELIARFVGRRVVRADLSAPCTNGAGQDPLSNR
jgi:hypothetical protein